MVFSNGVISVEQQPNVDANEEKILLSCEDNSKSPVINSVINDEHEKMCNGIASTILTTSNRCPMSSMKKPYPLRNIMTNEVLYDTLHRRADVGPCTEQRCGGSIFMPKSSDPREYGEPRSVDETKKQAAEFLQEVYSLKNMKNSVEEKTRINEVFKEIERTGVYRMTTEELEWGGKLAWRNAPRCIGRIQWKKLKVIDYRDVQTTEEMYQCLLQLLDYSTNGGNLRSSIGVFPPRTKKGKDFQIWNAQLMRYAGYLEEDGSILGDPFGVEITQVAQKLGWKSKRTQFDLLPWILQANGGPPELYEIPKEKVLEIPIRHPNYPGINELNLKWYATPAVANFLFDCGGLEFTAAPFSGWYMATEVAVRDLCDSGRYNLLKPIGMKLGLDVTNHTSFWKDEVVIAMVKTVLYSYNKAGVTMTDHHTASESFMKHLKDETKIRGGCPADWVWIVPPVSGSSTPVFHQEMLNYHLRPSLDYQPELCTMFLRGEMKKHTVKAMGYLSWFATSLMRKVLQRRRKVTILYATETGRAENYAKNLNKTFLSAFDSKVICMEDYEFSRIYQEECLLVVTSTFGNGEAPDNGKMFGEKLQDLSDLKWLENDGNLKKLRFGVFALGSSAYPNYCEFGKCVQKYLENIGATSILDMGTGDELKDQEEAFNFWKDFCFKKVCKMFGVKVNITESKISAEAKYRIESSSKDIIDGVTSDLSKIHKKDVFSNTFISKENLQSPSSGRVTNLVKIKINPSNLNDMQYLPGDHLSIHPPNDSDTVESLLDRTDTEVGYEDAIEITCDNPFDAVQSNTMKSLPMPTTLHRIFTWFLDITSPPTAKLMKIFAKHCKSQDEKEKILKFANDHKKYEEWLQVYYPTILETLNMFPSIRIDAAAQIPYLPLLKPRYYSISSSQKVVSDEVHLTVAMVKYHVNNGNIEHSGLCSSFLNSISAGEMVPSYVRRTNAFRLPPDITIPFIMIGAGSGIAPFRSFWQQRQFDKESMKKPHNIESLLFFGCRNSDLDNLYENEINDVLQDGVISKVFHAYSRDGKYPKEYVQNVIQKKGDLLSDYLVNKNAHVYVCGDVSMAASVSDTMVAVLKKNQNLSLPEAENFINEMKRKNFYCEDIFGVTFKAGKTV